MKKNIILIILTIISIALIPFFFIGLIPLTVIIIYYFISGRKEETHTLRKKLWLFPIISNILFFYTFLSPLAFSSAGEYWIWGLIGTNSHTTFIAGNLNTLFLAVPTILVLVIAVIINFFTAKILKVGEKNDKNFMKKWIVSSLIAIHLHFITMICNLIFSPVILIFIAIYPVFPGFGLIILFISLVFSILGFLLYLIYHKKDVLLEQEGFVNKYGTLSLILVLMLLGLLFGVLLGGGLIFYPYPDSRISVIIAGTMGIIVSTGSIIVGLPGIIGKDKSRIRAVISLCLTLFTLSFAIYLLLRVV